MRYSTDLFQIVYEGRYPPDVRSLYPKSLTCKISINTQTAFVIVQLLLNFARGAVSIEEYLCMVNMAHMVKSGQLRANMTN